jgi:hypothetical protein
MAQLYGLAAVHHQLFQLGAVKAYPVLVPQVLGGVMELEPLGDLFGLCGDGKAAPARQGNIFAAVDGGLRLYILRLILLHGQRRLRIGCAGVSGSRSAAQCAGCHNVAAQQHHQRCQHPHHQFVHVFVFHGLHAPLIESAVFIAGTSKKAAQPCGQPCTYEQKRSVPQKRVHL